MNKLSKVSTVVGSLPLNGYTKENMIAGLELQIRAGVDYPSYPQLVPMVSQFLDPLTKVAPKISRVGDYFKLEGDTFEFPAEPVATEYGEFMIEYFINNPEQRSKIKGMKACLTGPFTIANDIMVASEVVDGKNPMIYPEPRAIMSKKLLLEIADFMANIAKRYSEMGFDIISMDEPVLSILVGKRKTLFHSDEDIVEILNRALSGIKKYSSVHVCGRVAPRLADILMKSKVSIMDHEFTGGENDATFSKEKLDGTDKTVAVGVVVSNVKYLNEGEIDQYVESVADLEASIKKYQDMLGADNIMFKPDCGFGGLWDTFKENGKIIVEKKLANLRKAMDNTM